MARNLFQNLFQNGRLSAGLNPQEYRQLMIQQAAAPMDQDPAAAEKLAFIKLNLHRTERIGRTYRVPEKLATLARAIKGHQTWLALTEPWCGDSAQCLPCIEKIADLNPKLDFRLVLRDSHPEIMDQFLTNGKRSIPRLVFFDAEGHELAQWGPRPAAAQAVFDEAKNLGLEKTDILEKLHLFYGRDRGQALTREFQPLLEALARS